MSLVHIQDLPQEIRDNMLYAVKYLTDNQLHLQLMNGLQHLQLNGHVMQLNQVKSQSEPIQLQNTMQQLRLPKDHMLLDGHTRSMQLKAHLPPLQFEEHVHPMQLKEQVQPMKMKGYAQLIQLDSHMQLHSDRMYDSNLVGRWGGIGHNRGSTYMHLTPPPSPPCEVSKRTPLKNSGS